MSELMQVLFTYLSETRIKEFLPPNYDRLCGALVEDLETAFTNTLSDSQQVLWDQWRGACLNYDHLYCQAVFQAAFTMARELG